MVRGEHLKKYGEIASPKKDVISFRVDSDQKEKYMRIPYNIRNQALRAMVRKLIHDNIENQR